MKIVELNIDLIHRQLEDKLIVIEIAQNNKTTGHRFYRDIAYAESPESTRIYLI